MKFSTVLGTFALSTLEAYRAFASPLEPGAQSLESRGTEYCCLQTELEGNTQNSFIAYPLPGLRGIVASADDCLIIVHQTSTPPSRGGCAEWFFEARYCQKYQLPAASVQEAKVCQSGHK
ncbi:hypothetical protein E4U09_001267 [Claviceps aff. purpurea]|uniref:Uncharacterized protein n=1 Tax=Claviceps aff. purpurea TaxID=1967640 RepID=A0A9P7TZI7_9HYPO|nr:hypothetical protein E4U09_001267 [Claviceps aff. purpurea]